MKKQKARIPWNLELRSDSDPHRLDLDADGGNDIGCYVLDIDID